MPYASSDTVDDDDDDGDESGSAGRKQASGASKKRPRPLDDDSDDEDTDGKANGDDDAFEPQSEALVRATCRRSHSLNHLRLTDSALGVTSCRCRQKKKRTT